MYCTSVEVHWVQYTWTQCYSANSIAVQSLKVLVSAGLLGALMVVQSGSCRNEGPTIAFLHSLWMKQSVAEGALQSCRGWESFSIMEDSLAIILLFQTTSTNSRRHPRTEIFLSAVEMLFPPSRPLRERWLMPPQCRKRSSGVPPALQKTSVSWVVL